MQLYIPFLYLIGKKNFTLLLIHPFTHTYANKVDAAMQGADPVHHSLSCPLRHLGPGRLDCQKKLQHVTTISTFQLRMCPSRPTLNPKLTFSVSFIVIERLRITPRDRA